LQLRLATTPGQSLATGVTRNPAAYEAFLKGRQAWNDTTAIGDREAVNQFLRALELDPDFALAHGALAEAYVSLANDGVEPASKVFPLAHTSAERALALDDRIVQAHTALAEYAFHYQWDYEKSDRYLQRALEVDPNYSVAYTRLSGQPERTQSPCRGAGGQPPFPGAQSARLQRRHRPGSDNGQAVRRGVARGPRGIERQVGASSVRA
jgi:adenylate cyclase